MKNQRYWIKERNNPQLGVYYVLLGKLTYDEARAMGNALYGENTLHQYDTEAEYLARVDELRKQGERVQ